MLCMVCFRCIEDPEDDVNEQRPKYRRTEKPEVVVSQEWCSKSGMPLLTEQLVIEGSWYEACLGHLRIDCTDTHHNSCGVEGKVY